MASAASRKSSALGWESASTKKIQSPRARAAPVLRARPIWLTGSNTTCAPAPFAISAVRSVELLSHTIRSEEHTSELQSPVHLVCRLLLEKKKMHPNEVRVHLDIIENGGLVVRERVRQSRGRPRDAWTFIFFFNDTATTEIYTLSLHDALPILAHDAGIAPRLATGFSSGPNGFSKQHSTSGLDRKSTRLNSSHPSISYAVF